MTRTADDSNNLLDALTDEVEATDRSGVMTKFGYGLLCEAVGERAAKIIKESLEQPRNAADRNKKIHRRYSKLRHGGASIEAAREQLYADGFDHDAVDRVIEKGPA